MRKIVGKSINSNIKQFWCKKCKISTNVIYKDDKGNTFCDNCINQDLNKRIYQENYNYIGNSKDKKYNNKSKRWNTRITFLIIILISKCKIGHDVNLSLFLLYKSLNF